MYNPDTPALAEDALQTFVLRPAAVARNSGHSPSKRPLDYLIRWVYERQQLEFRYNPQVEAYDIDSRIHRLVDRLYALVSPTQEEVGRGVRDVGR